MNKKAELYSQMLEEMFGEADSIRELQPSDGGSPIYAFFYHNFPQDGTITTITYGLSEGANPEWTEAKPEIILTLDTDKEDWGLAAALLASEFRAKRNFSHGDLFSLGKPITAESTMNAFFVYTPSLLDEEQSFIEFDDSMIQLVGLYPIYPEEVDLYNNIGLEEFWFNEDFDLYDPKRKNLAI
jgi:hypothetical protein